MVSVQALSAKQSLAALQELLAEAAAKGADATKLADGLRTRIQTAEAWEERANAFFTGEQKRPLQELQASPLFASLVLSVECSA